MADSVHYTKFCLPELQMPLEKVNQCAPGVAWVWFIQYTQSERDYYGSSRESTASFDVENKH